MRARPLLLRALLIPSLMICAPHVIGAVYASPPSSATTALLLFGASDHKTFLGCLNCGKFDSGSVCNAFGTNGSKFAADSIWNKFGTFGSKFSSDSPWNKFSSDGPIIVDKEGTSYGYFSANKFHTDRTRIQALVRLL